MAEINSTVQQNINPIGSKIRCNVTGVEVVVIVHSRRVVVFVHKVFMVRGKIRDKIIHIIRGAALYRSVGLINML